MQILVKSSFKHINRSIPDWDTPTGREVKSEAHYNQLLKQYNLMPYEKAEELRKRNEKGKEYKLSGASQQIIKEAKLKSRGGKLNLSLSDGLTQTMIDQGIVKPKGFGLEHLPAHLRRGL